MTECQAFLDVFTCCDARGKVEDKFCRSSSNRHCLETIGWIDGFRCCTINCDGSADHPTGDPNVIREGLSSRDGRCESVTERIKGIHRSGDHVPWFQTLIHKHSKSNSGLPVARVTEALKGPRYRCTSDLWSAVVRNALETNLGQPCG